MYEKWILTTKDKNKDGVVGVICRFYAFDYVDSFLRDYQHIVAHLDEDRIFVAKHRRCAVGECAYLQRVHRDTAALSSSNGDRQRMYFGVEHESDVALLQHLDIVHSLWFHTLDQGLRLHKHKDLKARRRSLERHLFVVLFFV